MKLPDPERQPFITPEELWAILDGRLGRSSIYEGAREYLRTGGASGIPCIRSGRRLLLPTAAIRRWAMIDDAPPAPSLHLVEP